MYPLYYYYDASVASHPSTVVKLWAISCKRRAFFLRTHGSKLLLLKEIPNVQLSDTTDVD